MNHETPARFLHNCVFGDDFFLDLQNAECTADHADKIHWIHLDLTNSEPVEWLAAQSGVDSAIVDALIAEETRPRSTATKSGVLVVLRGVNMNPGQDAEDMVSVRLWIEPQRVISARNRPLLSVRDLYTDVEKGGGPISSGSFLTELIERIADRIGDFVNTIEDRMGDAEDALEQADPREFRATLGSLRRQIAGVRRFLAPQRDALDRLNHISTDIFSDRDRQRLREESDRISRYLEDLDLARERAVVLQEAFVSQLAQEQNTRMYVLSVVAAIFLPLTFATGLLGMNVGGLPWVDDSSGFIASIVAMIAAGLALMLYFKWKKWI